MLEKIQTFDGPYRFLSNFYPISVEYEGIKFSSVEHAYQAAKTLDMNVRREIAQLPTAGKAKRAGKVIAPIREDWELVKFSIMLELVRKKFEHETLRYMLFLTRDSILIEGNNWGDTYWGICNNVGENNLGKILMQVRLELQEKYNPIR